MRIPLYIRIRHLLGRTGFILGSFFTLIGLIFVLYFSMIISWSILLADEEDFIQTTGMILEITETEYTVNEMPLFDHIYEYSDQEELLHKGDFLEFDGYYQKGESIPVEYLIKDHGKSRFMGNDKRNFDQIMFLGGWLFLIIGAVFLFTSFRRTRAEIIVLLAGKAAKGKLISAEPTDTRINDQPVYKMHFEFLDEYNKSQSFEIRTHLVGNILNEEESTIFYNPHDPSRAVVMNTLPHSVIRYLKKKGIQ